MGSVYTYVFKQVPLLHCVMHCKGDNVSELQDLMNVLQQEALVAERVAHPASGEQWEGRRDGTGV